MVRRTAYLNFCSDCNLRLKVVASGPVAMTSEVQALRVEALVLALTSLSALAEVYTVWMLSSKV